MILPQILNLYDYFTFFLTEVAATTRICKSRKSRRHGSGGREGGGKREGEETRSGGGEAKGCFLSPLLGGAVWPPPSFGGAAFLPLLWVVLPFLLF